MLMADHIKAHNPRRQIEFLKQEKAMLVESSKKLADLEERYIQDIKIPPEEPNFLHITHNELKEEEETETETTGEMDDKEREDTFTQVCVLLLDLDLLVLFLLSFRKVSKFDNNDKKCERETRQ